MPVAARFPFFKSISTALRAGGLIFEGFKKLFACRNGTFCRMFPGVIPQKSDHGNGLVEFFSDMLFQKGTWTATMNRAYNMFDSSGSVLLGMAGLN